jgi:hypothetical protein
MTDEDSQELIFDEQSYTPGIPCWNVANGRRLFKVTYVEHLTFFVKYLTVNI